MTLMHWLTPDSTFTRLTGEIKTALNAVITFYSECLLDLSFYDVQAWPEGLLL